MVKQISSFDTLRFTLNGPQLETSPSISNAGVALSPAASWASLISGGKNDKPIAVGVQSFRFREFRKASLPSSLLLSNMITPSSSQSVSLPKIIEIIDTPKFVVVHKGSAIHASSSYLNHTSRVFYDYHDYRVDMRLLNSWGGGFTSVPDQVRFDRYNRRNRP